MSQDSENALSHLLDGLRYFRSPKVQIVISVTKIGIPRKCEGSCRLVGQLRTCPIRSGILRNELTCLESPPHSRQRQEDIAFVPFSRLDKFRQEITNCPTYDV